MWSEKSLQWGRFDLSPHQHLNTRKITVFSNQKKWETCSLWWSSGNQGFRNNRLVHPSLNDCNSCYTPVSTEKLKIQCCFLHSHTQTQFSILFLPLLLFRMPVSFLFFSFFCFARGCMFVRSNWTPYWKASVILTSFAAVLHCFVFCEALKICSRTNES